MHKKFSIFKAYTGLSKRSRLLYIYIFLMQKSIHVRHVHAKTAVHVHQWVQLSNAAAEVIAMVSIVLIVLPQRQCQQQPKVSLSHK